MARASAARSESPRSCNAVAASNGARARVLVCKLARKPFNPKSLVVLTQPRNWRADKRELLEQEQFLAAKRLDEGARKRVRDMTPKERSEWFHRKFGKEFAEFVQKKEKAEEIKRAAQAVKRARTGAGARRFQPPRRFQPLLRPSLQPFRYAAGTSPSDLSRADKAYNAALAKRVEKDLAAQASAEEALRQERLLQEAAKTEAERAALVNGEFLEGKRRLALQRKVFDHWRQFAKNASAKKAAREARDEELRDAKLKLEMSDGEGSDEETAPVAAPEAPSTIGSEWTKERLPVIPEEEVDVDAQALVDRVTEKAKEAMKRVVATVDASKLDFSDPTGADAVAPRSPR